MPFNQANCAEGAKVLLDLGIGHAKRGCDSLLIEIVGLSVA